jgi:hypothetical protein
MYAGRAARLSSRAPLTLVAQMKSGSNTVMDRISDCEALDTLSPIVKVEGRKMPRRACLVEEEETPPW